jgi:hypothetical protein
MLMKKVEVYSKSQERHVDLFYASNKKPSNPEGGGTDNYHA